MNRSPLARALGEARMVVAALAVATASAVPLAIAASHSDLTPAGDPVILLRATGKGVQVYECRDAEGRARWMLAGPLAELVDADGHVAGDHGTGPYWAWQDGSRIVGTVVARVDAPVPGAVPWLLLRAQSVGGPGVLRGVTYVQRVLTAGGVAPGTGCTNEQIGSRVSVPYSALYVFLADGRGANLGEALSQR